MVYKIKKKLVHFYTHGNIAEDFVASRREKVSKIRRLICLMFYIHCGLAIFGIVLPILLGNGLTAIAAVLGAMVSCGLAFLAVGDMMPLKEISCATDLVLTAVWFISSGFAEHKAAFVVCGVITALSLLADCVVLCAAWCRWYLEGLNPLLVRREDYTLMRSLTADLPAEDEPEVTLPPLTSEMRELARQMREVIRESVKSGETASETEPKTEQFSG